MGLFVLSGKVSFIDKVKAGLKTDRMQSFGTTGEFLEGVFERSGGKTDLLILDLSSVPDATRLIEFLRRSDSLARVQIIAVGSEEELAAFESIQRRVLDGKLWAPCSGLELAFAVARLREKRESS